MTEIARVPQLLRRDLTLLVPFEYGLGPVPRGVISPALKQKCPILSFSREQLAQAQIHTFQTTRITAGTQLTGYHRRVMSR